MGRDRLAADLRRVHDRVANTTIEVYEPTESFTQGEGYNISYPSSADATYDGRIDEVGEDDERERFGTSVEFDAEATVRDDTGQSWTGFGESGEAATKVVDTSTGDEYEVRAVTSGRNGITYLAIAQL